VSSSKTITAEVPVDKLYDFIHQMRDIGFTITIQWDDVIAMWLVTLN